MKQIATLFLAVVLAACSGMPVRNQLRLASDANAEYTQRVTLLLGADLITVSEAKEKLALIEQARDVVRMATVYLDQCTLAKETTCPKATNQLGLARSIGQQLEIELLKREKEKRQ